MARVGHGNDRPEVPRMSPGISEIMQECWAKAPASRPKMTDVAARIRKDIDTPPVVPTPITWAQLPVVAAAIPTDVQVMPSVTVVCPSSVGLSAARRPIPSLSLAAAALLQTDTGTLMRQGIYQVTVVADILL